MSHQWDCEMESIFSARVIDDVSDCDAYLLRKRRGPLERAGVILAKYMIAKSFYFLLANSYRLTGNQGLDNK